MLANSRFLSAPKEPFCPHDAGKCPVRSVSCSAKVDRAGKAPGRAQEDGNVLAHTAEYYIQTAVLVPTPAATDLEL